MKRTAMIIALALLSVSLLVTISSSVMGQTEEPNLAITSVMFEPSYPSEGQSVTIEIVLVNTGGADAENVRFVFSADGEDAGAVVLERLPANSKKTVVFTWMPERAGKYTLVFTADPDDTIQESNENDNAFSESVKVVSAPQKSTSTNTAISVFGILIIVIPVVIIIIVVVVVYFLMQRSQAPPPMPPPYPPYHPGQVPPTQMGPPQHHMGPPQPPQYPPPRPPQYPQ